MEKLKPGLYEKLISEHLKQELDAIPEARKATGELDYAEAPKQAKLVNDMISAIDPEDLTVADGARQLLAVMADNDPKLALGKEAKDVMTRPETSLAQSSLFTGAVHEPQMFSELKKEISSANRIDMLVSFIKWSGLRLIIEELRTFAQNGGKLRIWGRQTLRRLRSLIKSQVQK